MTADPLAHRHRDALGPQASRAARAARPSTASTSSRSTISASRASSIEDGLTFETNARIKARFAARGHRPAGPGRRFRARGRRARWPARRPDAAVCGPERHRRGEQRQAARRARGTASGAAHGAATSACSRSRPRTRRRRAACRIEIRRGTTRGRIAEAPRGSGGFGYDPIFEPQAEPPGGRTFGEYAAAEKHRISHRARAARRMAPLLRLIEPASSA